ncbi:MAG: peptidase domain-containing ABC transporter [Eudoraea sp.]|uniref:peptidase domain-containing ABC transporter n=3 Tax=Eudoraea sp. TaxID=1979955 RepID=UPI003C76432A
MSKTEVKQHDVTDCGAACIASIAAHYKLQIPISRIRQVAGTDKKGTNALGLLEAANKFGFEGKGVKADFESLYYIPKPAIAHMIVEERLYHYVVIYELTKHHIKIMDPSHGKCRKLTFDQFNKQWTGVLVLLTPSQEFRPGNLKVSINNRLWALLKPHKWVLFQAFIGAVIYTLLGFTTAIYIQKLTDFVFVGGNKGLLNLLGIIMVILLIFQLFIGAFKDVFLLKIGQQIDVRLILGYYKHLLKLPQQFFDNMRVGEIISRINDAVKIRAFINGVSLNLTVNCLIIVFSYVLMFSFYWKLALIMTSIIPLYLGIYYLMNYLNKKTERKIMEESADLESQLVESLNTISTIKRFRLEDFSNIRTETKFINLLRTAYYSTLNNIFSNTSSNAIARVSTIALLWTGSFFVLRQEITPGELMSFYAITSYFTGPMIYLINSNKEIQNALIAADRLFEILDLEQEEGINKIELKKGVIGDIIFKDVSFRYGSRKNVFKKLNLRIPHSKVTAIVGESGCGKTTIISLLQNIYPIKKGRISIGKMNLELVENSSLRDLVSVVPQKIDLFAGSVIENIAIGEFLPNLEKIERICKTIGILDFIEELPEGFYTYLGENGVALSGGQRQRIAIARALYKEPEILVLDEATSSLDSEAESYIQRAIQQMQKQKKTVIIIAHRLSTIVHADNIIVLKKGKVKEVGPHKDLIKKRGHYYQLWERQYPRII